MGRGSYVVHNAFFDCGGPWGIIQTVLAAYIEARTGRPFRSFFDTLTGASIGGVNAIVLGLGIPAKTLGHSIYACSIDLFKDASDTMIRNQVLNKKFHLGLKDHHDHMLLYHTLLPYFGEKTIGDIQTSVLVASHNMDRKLNFWFGRMDPSMFDERMLKSPLVNGTTRLLDASMATTSIPGIFRPWEFQDEHYRDFGPAISAGKAHKELDAALQSRFRQLIRDRRDKPMNRREALTLRFARDTREGPRTLDNADGAVVRTIFLGTGDLSNLPYTKALQFNAGIMGAMDDQEYSTLHFMKQNASQEDRADMERYYDGKTLAATGQPAITRINKSLVWKQGDSFEKSNFPSLRQMDCSPENLHKVFRFAGLSLQQNLPLIAEVLREITITQRAQGKIEPVEYQRMIAICNEIGQEDPLPLLHRENIMVTPDNARAVYEEHRAVMPASVARYAPPTMIRRAASAVGGLWRRPVPA